MAWFYSSHQNEGHVFQNQASSYKGLVTGGYNFSNHKKEYNYKIKEADIPLDILFNKEINQIKLIEHVEKQKPKPITFRIMDDDEDELKAQFQGSVRFEIEGGGDILTSFVRKNEQEFFEFLVDFNQKNPEQTQKSKFHSQGKGFVPQISLRRRRSSKVSQFSSGSRLGTRNRNSPNFLRGGSRQEN